MSKSAALAFDAPDFLAGGGKAGALIRAIDWATTPLGSPEQWPYPLKTLVGVMLAAGQPMFVAWGAERRLLYNDSYAVMLADRHPAALGQPILEVWHEVRADIAPLVEQVFAGKPVEMSNITLQLDRPGRPRDAHFAFSYTPVRDESGEILGLFCPCTETTEQVVAERIRSEAAERQRMLLQQMPGFVAVLSGPDHVYEYVNDAYITLAGSRDFLGRKVRDAFPEIEGQGYYELLDRVYASGEPYVAREAMVRLAGNAKDSYVDLLYEPIRDDTGAISGIFVGGYDVTERVLVEQRRSALLTLDDRLRDVSDPVDLSYAASELLGEVLRASRVGYGAIDPEAGTITVERCWRVPGLDSVAGVHLAADYGGYFDELRAGANVKNADVTTDPRTSGNTEPFQWLGIRAFLDVPVVEQGKTIAEMFVHSIAPRIWTEEEAAFVSEFAERTRAAIARRVAEQELRASEARLRAIVNAVPVGLVYADANGRVTGGNAHIEEIVGHRVFLSNGLEDYEDWVSFHPDGRRVQRDEYPLARVISGAEQRPELEVLYRRGDGREAWVRFVAAPVHGPDGRIVGGVVATLDIDRERRAQERLRELNANLEQQVIERTQARGRTWQVTPDLMGALNADGYFKTSNPAWKTVLGWSETEVASKSIWELLHPDDIERTRLGFELTKVGQPAIQFPNRYRCKDGSYRWISWVGVPEDGLIYCIGRDITAEKAQEVELKARTAERDQLWTLAEEMLARANYSGMMTAVNPAWTKVLGFQESELLTRPYSDFMHPDDVGVTLAALQSMGRTKQPTRFENRIMTAAGDWKPIGWTVAPEPDGINFIAVGRDLEDAKRREAELAAAQEALRQSQKMEAVGQLTGGIAHDFNNMLAVVIGSLDLLARRTGAADVRAKRYVDAATDGARRAALLTQRLLAFSRQQPLRPEPIDANKLVAGMSELIRGALGADVRLETVLASGLWRTQADPNQLENVILNLAVNGRDAMPDGGRLTLETQNAHLDERYVAGHLGVHAGQYILIAVTDTGTGMPEDVVAKVFDPFFTTKEVGKGTGLGLSQVYGFVKQSGGHVKVYSEPGQGTTVKVYLPRLLGAVSEQESAETSSELPLGESQEVILVVEDEPAVRQFSIDALTELGYPIIEADSAATALRLLDAHPEIALMFTDVVMPEVNGAKLAVEARKRRPGLRILFTTGYTRNAVVHNGVLDQGVQLLGKPFSIEELAAKVREVLDAPIAEPGA
ncbi:MAG: hybrid sensor histidine kinase/response regulator [Hyphomicrobiales bacterium]|nr:hybrid sensor histidine kinase/response regulator [Hyphomicrobiales bacterium]